METKYRVNGEAHCAGCGVLLVDGERKYHYPDGVFCHDCADPTTTKNTGRLLVHLKKAEGLVYAAAKELQQALNEADPVEAIVILALTGDTAQVAARISELRSAVQATKA